MRTSANLLNGVRTELLWSSTFILVLLLLLLHHISMALALALCIIQNNVQILVDVALLSTPDRN